MRYILIFLALITGLLQSCKQDHISRQGKVPPQLGQIQFDVPFKVAVAVQSDTLPVLGQIPVWANCSTRQVPITDIKTDAIHYKDKLVCDKFVGRYYLYEGVMVVINDDGDQTPTKVTFISQGPITANQLEYTDYGAYIRVQARYDLKTENWPSDSDPVLVKLE